MMKFNPDNGTYYQKRLFFYNTNIYTNFKISKKS